MKMISRSVIIHAGILGLLTVCGLFSQNLLSERHKAELEQTRAVAKHTAIKSKLEAWKGNRYSHPDSPRFLQVVKRSEDWKSLSIRAVQKEALAERLEEILPYVCEPTVEEYLRLRTESGSYRFRTSPRVVELLRKTPAGALEIVGARPAVVVRVLWDNPSVWAPPRWSPRIEGIAYDSVAVAISDDTATTAVLYGKASRGQTGAMLALNPGFEHGGGSAEALESDRFAHIGFLAKSTAPDGVGPVHISLKWVEEEQTWVMDRLFTDILLKFTTMF